MVGAFFVLELMEVIESSKSSSSTGEAAGCPARSCPSGSVAKRACLLSKNFGRADLLHVAIRHGVASFDPLVWTVSSDMLSLPGD